MPDFKYKARDNFARLTSGIISAEKKDLAAKKLQEMGYVPISIDETTQSRKQKFFPGFKRISLPELNNFTRQLYSLQKAGLPLFTSLQTIAEQTKNRYFKIVIEEVIADVRGGLSFSASLKKHSHIFDEIYTSMIKAAETGGFLMESLQKLTELIEQQIDTRNRIKSATQYPLLAFFVLCIGFLIVVTFVIPRFSAIYAQFKTSLPLPTQVLIVLNLIIKRFWYLLILAIGGLIFGFRYFISSKTGRPIWDNFKLKIPILGQLVSLLVMSRFARVTATLMKSGVPILEILDLVANASGNIIIARSIKNIKESVNQGRGISEPMKVSNLFPPVVVQMVAVGEQTGRVDDLLLSVADYYDREAGYLIKNLSTYIEPILIFILGIMVLVMALAIFLPLWNLITLFRQGA